jgi:hypothetical protein
VRARLGFLLLTLALSALSGAQAAVALRFGQDGRYAVWTAAADSWQAPEDASTFTGTTGVIEIEAAEKGRLIIADLDRNLLAARPAKDALKAKSWDLKPADWTRAAEIRVQASAPVDGLVRAEAGGEEQTALIAAADDSVSFFGLKRGPAAFSLDARIDGETRTAGPARFDLKDPGPAEEALAIRIPSDWPAPKAAEGSEKAAGEEAPNEDESKPASGPSFLSTLLNLAIALAIIGGASYFVWRWIKSNPERAKEALAQAGIQDPGAGADPADLPPPPAPSQKPMERIILDGSAPIPAPAPSAAPVMAAANPRLVLASGDLFLVPDGEATVGRDEGREWRIEGESSVSRLHARLIRTGDDVTLSDAGSTNGTWVNGEKIIGARLLKPGDQVLIGSVQARFEA